MMIEFKTTNADYTTITEAITAAKPYDTILVSAREYKEQITINKPLTLLGAGADVDPINVGRAGGESTINSTFAVTIAANNVIINGFEITNFRYGIFVPANSFSAPNYILENILIKFNWIHSNAATLGFGAQPGVLKNVTITNNIIHVNNTLPSLALNAIGFISGATTTPIYERIEISNNDIMNLSPERYGIFAGANPSIYMINGIKISCNHFRSLDNGSFINIGNIINGSFVNNVVENAGGTIGIEIGEISGNTFMNGGNISLWGNEYGFTRPSRSVEVFNNLFTNEVFGRGLRVRPGAKADEIKVHDNAFLDSLIKPTITPDDNTGYLVVNDGDGMLDVACNWWNSEHGPKENTGDIKGIAFTKPWITDQTDEAWSFFVEVSYFVQD